MAAIEVPNNDPGFGLRSGVTAEQLARAKREYEESREQDARVEMTVFTVGAILVCLGFGWLYHRRSQVLAAVDTLTVDTAATGLRAKRKIGSALTPFITRVRDRAG